MERFDVRDTESHTPLIFAAQLGKDAAFKALLDLFPSECHAAVDIHGRNVVYLAAEGDHVSILKVCT